MEHNIENIIREKVNAAENSSTVWQKENVWLSIENNFEIKPHMSFRYYVAASASLAFGLFIFLLQPKNQIEQLKPNELTKINYKTEILPDHAKSITSVDDCKESGSIISYTLKNERIKSAHILNDAIISQKTVVINTPKIETTELKELPLQLEKSVDDKVAKHVEQVHAIFGVEEKPVVTFSTKRQKKVHIRLFNTEEGTSPIQNTSEPVNLFARINKN